VYHAPDTLAYRGFIVDHSCRRMKMRHGKHERTHTAP